MTDPRSTASAPSAPDLRQTGPFHADGIRERMLWPATAGVLLTLLLAWAALALVPAPWQRWAAGLAVVVGVLATTLGCARAAVRWVADDARASAGQLAAHVRWLAPGRADPTVVPSPLRPVVEQAMRLAVAHARTHDGSHAAADQAALGENVAGRLERLAHTLDAAVEAQATARDDAGRAHATEMTRTARASLAELAGALRRAAAPVAPPDAIHDAAALVLEAATSVRATLGEGALAVREDGARAPVRLHAPSFGAALAAVLRAAAGDSAPSPAALHLRRTRRAAYEDEPVRRAEDSPRTIVPRMPQSVVRQWVAATMPPAEVLSVVVADASHAVDPVDRARALDPFGVARPADPMGLALAELRRVVERAQGCIWLDDAREGGTAVHFLLPIAVEG